MSDKALLIIFLVGFGAIVGWLIPLTRDVWNIERKIGK